jgi:hypothetical protein
MYRYTNLLPRSNFYKRLAYSFLKENWILQRQNQCQKLVKVILSCIIKYFRPADATFVTLMKVVRKNIIKVWRYAGAWAQLARARASHLPFHVLGSCRPQPHVSPQFHPQFLNHFLPTKGFSFVKIKNITMCTYGILKSHIIINNVDSKQPLPE